MRLSQVAINPGLAGPGNATLGAAGPVPLSVPSATAPSQLQPEGMFVSTKK